MKASEENIRSKRARKLTEKGQEYAQARASTGIATHLLPEPLAKQKQKAVSGKAVKKTSTLSSSKGMLASSTSVASTQKSKTPKFSIEALTTNRTSEKGNTINFEAHAQLMPRPAVSAARIISGERHKMSPATKDSHRLTNKKAAQLMALRGPYQGKRPLATMPSSNAHEGRKVPATPVPSSSKSQPVHLHMLSDSQRLDRKTRARSLSPMDQRPHQQDQDYQEEPRLRTYNMSALPEMQANGQIPTRHMREYDGSGGEDNFEDYGSQPRARAKAIAYHSSAEDLFHAHEQPEDGEPEDDDVDEDGGPQVSYSHRSYSYYNQYEDDMDGDQPSDSQVERPATYGHRDHSAGVSDDEPNIYDEPEDAPDNDEHGVSEEEDEHQQDAPPVKRRRIADDATAFGQPQAHVKNFRKACRVTDPPQAQPDNGTQRTKVRPRAADYEPEAQEVLKVAAGIYKSQIMSKEAYPSKLTEKTWAAEAWHRAAKELDIELAPNSELINLITRYSWNLRGELKSAARSQARGAYGFKSTEQAEPANRKRAAQIRRARSFTYEVIADDPEDNDGLYEADIIQAVINQVFYKSPDDDGVTHSDVYKVFPVPGLALVLSAIQCAIDEWSTGPFKKVTFAEEAYLGVYEQHLKELRAFEKESGDDAVLTDLCKEIARRGRHHAKAPPEANAQDTSSLSTTAMRGAVASYQRRKAALAASRAANRATSG